MLREVEWGEYRLGDLFDVKTSARRFDANKVKILKAGGHPYIVRLGSNNGQKGFIDEDKAFLNEGNTISFGQDTATVYYQEAPYFTGDKIKILKPKIKQFNKKNAQFFVTAIALAFSTFSWGTSSYNENVIREQKIQLPVLNGEINFPFMERFIAELDAQNNAMLEAHLSASGLKDTRLSLEEKKALLDYDKLEWDSFNLKELFGKATRGKRLKSDDRIPGRLPFVTAGEAEEGVSAFIGNKVDIFSKNTITIDMFGSAKYRNYDYGGDDHIAVVHTESLSKYASIFITSAIHKSSHNGQFNYGHNFYAKDADTLNIMLPVVNGEVAYSYMDTLISAIHKLVIKDVVQFSDREMSATVHTVNQNH